MEVEALKPRSVEEALGAIRGALDRGAWLVFWARCSAEYEGRSASKLAPGDVLVVVKPDRSVIVHGPRGFKPLNWQPDASSLSASVEGGQLVFRAVRRSLREVLTLRCPVVYSVSYATGAVEGEFYMYVSEAEIRDYLAANPGELGEGLEVVRVERPVEPGFVDLYARDPEGRVVIVEVKRVKAGEEAARQLLRYVEHFRRRGVPVRGILAAPDFTEAALRLLSEAGLEYRRVSLEKVYRWVRGRSRARRGILDYLNPPSGG
ncbi:endonuclease NucS [Stetteria hydrogenophila]